MRVLNVTLLIDPQFGGGTSERTCQLSIALLKLGIDCEILTTDYGLSEERISSLNGVNVIALPCIYKRFYIFKFPFKRLKEIIEGFDVIHLMGHWSILNVMVYFLARSTKTPYVICPAGELNIFGRSRWIKKSFNFLIGQKIVEEASGYIAVAKNELIDFQKYNVCPKNVKIIPNGVNPIDFKRLNTCSFSDEHSLHLSPFILFMGRLNYIKGPDLLLEAFALVAKQFPEYHLVFAGPDGGLLLSLQEAARTKSLSDRIHFVGYLSGDDRVNAYREAEILVIPSRQEAMSIVVLEAGINGLPVLLTNTCGFDEVGVIEGGKVVNPTVEGLRGGLELMLTQRDKLKRMGENLRVFTIKNFTWEQACKQYLEIYAKIITSGKNN